MSMVNGAKIRTLRNELGLSQDALGDLVGVGGSMIKHIERGVKKPSVDLLKRIADVYGCTVDDLLKDDSATNTEGVA